MDLTQIEARLELFIGMLSSCHNLYLWQYDSGFHLIKSNCPQQTAVNNLFGLLRGGKLTDRQLCDQDAAPILLNNSIGMMWILQPYLEGGEAIRNYVLRPLFLDDVSSKSLEAQLDSHGLNDSLRRSAMQFLQQLPIISLSRVFEYAIMLHYCITGQTIQVSDLRYDDHSNQPAVFSGEQTDIHGTYEAEQEMIRMVREGDITNYRAHLDRLSLTGRMGKISNDDPLRQMKNAVITCLVLFSRAAMEGGLDPEVSYTLSDRYFQSIEACSSISDLVEIALPMQEDYIQRVHRCRTGGLSQPVQACCDYISLHLEEHLDLPTLARQAGYAEYYLSRKFKKETGLAPSTYIRQKRLERAAHLLRTTQEDVQEISDRLQFCSQSHFSDCFRKQYGMTPSAYRTGTE